MGLAYTMRSRLGVTAAFEKIADATEIEFEKKVIDNLSDEQFWKRAQRILDRVLNVATKVIKEELKC